MRKWHRWLSVLFGVVLLWISVTGLLSQIPLWGEVLGGKEERPAAAAPAGFKCPETMLCRPKPPKSALNIGLIHHLHSGESLGPVGTVVFTLAGFAMVFFSFSGLWLYVQMWQNRKVRGVTPKWFWQ
ncbi:PepSY domain-containing protein [Novosphingobium sp. B 225]|uniref:PepSY domain-containing protein n=1 Tax=Novosphingobium sp. B 225 TaxID=1961849 RepID=UPI000B4BBE77|nr:PepSY domain-containing protein [Novosphingobium sp. B 225]